MPTNSVLTRAHALWEGLAGAPVSFSSAEPVDVAISPRAMICLEEVLGPATLAYVALALGFRELGAQLSARLS